jgi:hypothetical protein
MRSAREAFLGGITAAAVMSAMMALGRLAGLRGDLELGLGVLVSGSVGRGAWPLGFLLHLLLGGLIGLVYAALLDRFMLREQPGAGVYLGLCHAIAAGVLVGALGAAQPAVANAAGLSLFMGAGGVAGVIWFFMLHVTFGGVFAGLYGRRWRWVFGEEPQYPSDAVS